MRITKTKEQAEVEQRRKEALARMADSEVEIACQKDFMYNFVHNWQPVNYKSTLTDKCPCCGSTDLNDISGMFDHIDRISYKGRHYEASARKMRCNKCNSEWITDYYNIKETSKPDDPTFVLPIIVAGIAPAIIFAMIIKNPVLMVILAFIMVALSVFITILNAKLHYGKEKHLSTNDASHIIQDMEKYIT